MPKPVKPPPPTKSTNLPSRIEVRDTYDPEGNLFRREEGYVDADGNFIRHGKLTNYWKSGAKKSEVTFVHGVKRGERWAWYEDGQKWSYGYYDENGLEHGTWITWYPNGKKALEFTMEHGAFNGPYMEWHPNGQLKRQFEYVHGKKQGLEIFWDENGNMVKTVEWVDGRPQP
ncbi:MAG: toxin-antitoxin system YwqK family antitoxin [Planctomycetota bacterium]|nr:MAG: toxin-antitoxin system YwqK family antitoxin [Planctomycetota bacterium]